MVPRIVVRRQVRFGLPVAIERLRGRQYRCLRCNAVFYELEMLDLHLRGESAGVDSTSVPPLEQPIALRLLYMEDQREKSGEHLRPRRAIKSVRRPRRR